MPRLLWDFFGPHAAPTAAHFERHLVERCEREAWPVLRTGTESAGPGHTAVYALVSDDMVPTLRGPLRPQRLLPDPVEDAEQAAPQGDASPPEDGNP